MPTPRRRQLGMVLAVWSIAFSLLAVTSARPLPPVARLGVDDASPFVGEPVRFDASASLGHDRGGGRIESYRFDFGDGSGTGWQTSPFVTHSYGAAGFVTASVTVRDGRGLQAQATVVLEVRNAPPPTGDAPDLTPIQASTAPARPEEKATVILAVVLQNRGGSAAEAAAVDVTDERPSGMKVFVERMILRNVLDPGAAVVLFSKPFRAVEAGDHTLRILVRDVSPAETFTDDNALPILMTVLPASDGGNGNGGNGNGEDGRPLPAFDPTVLGLLLAAGAALVGAMIFLTRPPPEPALREPPSHVPPDRRPPPAWPP